ncbi:MAG: magnesium transporter [Candidatus Hydrogenedentota bacterium]|nr:MAG: magnesium transporter [Candidatus Hydrogenedentota bacterium]
MNEVLEPYVRITEGNSEKVIRIFKRLIEKRNATRLKKFIDNIHPSDLALIWDAFDENEKEILLNLLDSEKSAELLSYLNPQDRSEIFETKDENWIADRLEELESDDAVDILKELPAKKASFVIRRFDPEYSQKIKELIRYPEETAGALMSSDFFAVNENATIGKIIRKFKEVSDESELDDIHFIYVVDDENHLQGYIPLRKLILEKTHKKAKEIMSRVPAVVTPEMDQEEVARIFKQYDLISIPVVDEQNTLLGRITIDDIVDVLESESSEDVFRMMGLNKDERLTDSVFVSFKHRLPWMFINLITTSLSALVIGMFTNVLKVHVALAMFMPMVAALGGATGNQMVAMIVRGLALGEMHWRHVRYLLFREVLAVTAGAMIIGSIAGVIAWQMNQNPHLGTVLFVAMIANMVFATLVGAGIPLVLKLLKLDPALGSSILVAASTDLAGFFIFLGLATIFL